MGSIIDAAQPTMWTIDLKWLGLTFDIHPELQQNYGNAMLLVKNDIFTIYEKLKILYFPFFNYINLLRNISRPWYIVKLLYQSM